MSRAEPMGASRRAENYRIRNGQAPGSRRLTGPQWRRFSHKYSRAIAMDERKAMAAAQ